MGNQVLKRKLRATSLEKITPFSPRLDLVQSKMAPRTQALVLVGVCLTPAAAYLHAPLQRSALVRANIALPPLRPPIHPRCGSLPRRS